MIDNKRNSELLNYLAMFWPIRDSVYDSNALLVLGKNFRIKKIKNVIVLLSGLKNIMVEVYGKENWLGSIEDHFKGALNYAKSCYKEDSPLKLVVFEADSIDEVKKAKQTIRDIYTIGNYSLHIPDTEQENRLLTNMLLNEQSIGFLNSAQPFLYSKLYKNIQHFKKDIEMYKLDINRFVIDSSSVLEAYGIREALDLDYITDYDDGEDKSVFGENHKDILKYYNASAMELLYDSDNFFWYQGVKFLTLSNVRLMKMRRDEEKDKEDIGLIDDYLKPAKQ